MSKNPYFGHLPTWRNRQDLAYALDNLPRFLVLVVVVIPLDIISIDFLSSWMYAITGCEDESFGISGTVHVGFGQGMSRISNTVACRVLGSEYAMCIPSRPEVIITTAATAETSKLYSHRRNDDDDDDKFFA
ncbi:hypothetical protein BGX31_001452 [Mortierella sp. GBA43]|nr:hypothetical protein BGX31_001452 [Mortierella sp. GBA43]